MPSTSGSDSDGCLPVDLQKEHVLECVWARNLFLLDLIHWTRECVPVCTVCEIDHRKMRKQTIHCMCVCVGVFVLESVYVCSGV